MMDESDVITFQKILVAVDASIHSRAALEAAMTFARLTEAKVHGVFVRPAVWYHISRLPSMSEINELTGEVSPLMEQTMEKHIRLLENRVRRMMYEMGLKKRVVPSWKSVEGTVEEQILEAAETADLVTLGSLGHSFPKQRRLGRSARAIIERSDKPVLILQGGLRIGRTIICVYDGSNQSLKGLKTALSLARKSNRKLFLLVLGKDPEAIKEHDETIRTLLGKPPDQLKIEFIRYPHLWHFVRLVNQIPGNLLIIPKNQPLLKSKPLDQLLSQLNHPLLLV